MTYIPRMCESASGWIGEGRLVYSTNRKPNTPLADNSALQQLQSQYKNAQTQRKATHVSGNTRKNTTPKGHVTVYDASKRMYVSATPEEAKLIQTANKTIKTPASNLPVVVEKPKYNFGEIFNNGSGFKINNPFISAGSETNAGSISGGIGTRAGLNGIGCRTGVRTTAAGVQNINLPVPVRSSSNNVNIPAIINRGSAEVQELQVISQTVNESKKSGIWSKLKSGISGLTSKLKNGISGLWTKAKSFVKTPKGKLGLAIAALALVGTALCCYVADRFSDKNKPNLTEGPSKIFMPKLGDENEDEAETVSKTEETNQEESEDTVNEENNDSVVAVPIADADNENAKNSQETTKDNSDKTTPVNPNIHKVVEGDNLWNIAKQNLKNMHKDDKNYEPTNKEILEKTEELMKLNNKEYEQPLPADSKKRKVLIIPDEEIKLK